MDIPDTQSGIYQRPNLDRQSFLLAPVGHNRHFETDRGMKKPQTLVLRRNDELIYILNYLLY
jgi:hypothetical protein